MPLYANLGLQKKLNEIVFAGTHDAGIDRGRQWTRTQSLNIREQAEVGVRIFDLRVAASKITKSGKVEHRAFHGSAIKSTHQVKMAGGVKTEVVEYTMKAGNFGMQLSKMLADAKSFVADHPTEFLLLKFDKSENFPLIAAECSDILGAAMLRGRRNLNESTLYDLRGKVVVMFPAAEISPMTTGGPDQGIHPWRSLKGGGAYDASGIGLQYYGKGGTSKASGYKKTKYGNITTQRGLMHEMQRTSGRGAMGMLYWTMTGVLGDIHGRNKKLWNTANVERLKTLWVQSLGFYTMERLVTPLAPNSPALGPSIKNAIPNILMIDFAGPENCQIIYDLNHMTYREFEALATNYDVLIST